MDEYTLIPTEAPRIIFLNPLHTAWICMFFISGSLQNDAEKCCTDLVFWNVFYQQYMHSYTPNSNNSILDHNAVRICSNNYLFNVDRWLIKEKECIFKFAIMKKIYTTLSNGSAPRDSSWSFSFWAVQLAGNLSLMDWSSLSERPSAQPIRLIWSCRIAFFGVKTPCQTLGLRSFVLQNEIDRAAATGGMPAGRLNCGAWRAIMNRRAETASPLLHYKCSLLTAICNQWAQAFCQRPQIRQARLCVRVGGATGPPLSNWEEKAVLSLPDSWVRC